VTATQRDRLTFRRFLAYVIGTTLIFTALAVMIGFYAALILGGFVGGRALLTWMGVL